MCITITVGVVNANHVASDRLLLQLAVDIAASVPSTDEATAILQTLREYFWLNLAL